jgi:hypothetical protein
LDDHRKFEDYVTQLDRKVGARNGKIFLFADEFAANPKNTTFHSNIKDVFLPANCTSQLQPLHLEIIQAFKCHYGKQLIQKTVAVIDGGLLQDGTQMKLDVLSAVHFVAEVWRLVKPTTIKNVFVKCGFSNDHVSSNDGTAVSVKMKRLTDTVYNLLECSLGTAQHVTVLLRFLESRVLTSKINI